MIPFVRLPLLIFCSLFFAKAACADDQEKLTNLRERISSLQRKIDQTSESKFEAADELRELERAISDSNRKLVELAEQQRAADIKLGKLKAQEQKIISNMSGQQALLGRLLHQQYLGGRQEYLQLLLGNQNPNHVSRNLQYYQYIARHRATWLSSLRDDLASLNLISKTTLKHRSELVSLRKEQADQKRVLEKDRQSHRDLLKKISKRLHQQRHEFSRLQRNESRLVQLVEGLTKMLAQPKSSSLFRNDSLPDNRFDDKPFNQLKGKLVLPVRGEITNRFNTPRPESKVLWKGIFLRTSSGQAVKAIAAGQVVFADWLRGFGNMLIIDHGKGYMSLYGNNETIYKQVGDVLHGGDIVAAVGNSGGNEDFGLYFELRHQSKPLDPLKWIATR